MEIYIEPNVPKPNLLIVGDSPVAASLAALGPLLGYHVTLVAAGANARDLPSVDTLVTEVEDLPKHLMAPTYAIVATMGRYRRARPRPHRGCTGRVRRSGGEPQAGGLRPRHAPGGRTDGGSGRVDPQPRRPRHLGRVSGRDRAQHHGRIDPGPPNGPAVDGRGTPRRFRLSGPPGDRPGLPHGGRPLDAVAGDPRGNDLLLLRRQLPSEIREIARPLPTLTHGRRRTSRQAGSSFTRAASNRAVTFLSTVPFTSRSPTVAIVPDILISPVQ